MRNFAIAGLQYDLQGTNNVDAICKAVDQYMRTFPWVNMVILGELVSFGPSKANAQTLPNPSFSRYAELAKQHQIWLIPGSMFEQAGEHVYNTAMVFNPAGECVLQYRKLFPFQPYESDVSAGDSFGIFDVPEVGRFGLSICYDQWFPEVSRELACLGAEVIINPTMTSTVDRELELSIARTNAVVSQAYYFNINVAGKFGNGASIIVDPDGRVLHQAGERQAFMPVHIDLDQVSRSREKGMMGLGQTLKSFRDSKIEFSAYQASKNFTALNKLGPLARPDKQQSSE